MNVYHLKINDPDGACLFTLDTADYEELKETRSKKLTKLEPGQRLESCYSNKATFRKGCNTFGCDSNGPFLYVKRGKKKYKSYWQALTVIFDPAWKKQFVQAVKKHEEAIPPELA